MWSLSHGVKPPPSHPPPVECPVRVQCSNSWVPRGLVRAQLLRPKRAGKVYAVIACGWHFVSSESGGFDLHTATPPPHWRRPEKNRKHVGEGSGMQLLVTTCSQRLAFEVLLGPFDLLLPGFVPLVWHCQQSQPCSWLCLWLFLIVIELLNCW